MAIEIRKETIVNENKYLDAFEFLSNKKRLDKFGENVVFFIKPIRLNYPLDFLDECCLYSWDAEYFKISTDIYFSETNRKSSYKTAYDILRNLGDFIPKEIQYICDTSSRKINVAQATINDFVYDIMIIDYVTDDKKKKFFPKIEFSLEGNTEISINNIKYAVDNSLYLIENILNAAYKLSGRNMNLILKPHIELMCSEDSIMDYFAGDRGETIIPSSSPERQKADNSQHLNALSFKDIGGYEVEIEKMEDLLFLLQNKEYWPLAAKGVVIYGPPGTGKTMLAHAAINKGIREYNLYHEKLEGSDFKSMWYGKSIENLDRIFKRLIDKKPAILFIDEGDALLKSRLDNIHEATKEITNKILSFMDGAYDSSGVTIIITTNLNPRDPIVFDPAFIREGRIGEEHIIELGEPSLKQRQVIFEKYMERYKSFIADASTIDLSVLASKSEHFTGAHIHGVFKSVIRKKVSHARTQKGERKITIGFEDLLSAVCNVSGNKSKDAVKRPEIYA